MLRIHLGLETIEIRCVAGSYVDSADTEAHVASTNKVEVNEASERCAERIDIVDAERTGRAFWHERRRRHSWRKKAGHTYDRAQGGTRTSKAPMQCPEDRMRRHGGARRHAVPEATQARDALLRWITGNQRAVDGTDRHPGDPVGRTACLGQPFEYPCLVCAERSAALKHEDETVIWELGVACIHVDSSGGLFGGRGQS